MTEKAGRSVTRNDVAKLAGVSTAVVSYVVNNGPRPVAEATRQKVLDAIRKLDYQPTRLPVHSSQGARMLWRWSCRTWPTHTSGP